MKIIHVLASKAHRVTQNITHDLICSHKNVKMTILLQWLKWRDVLASEIRLGLVLPTF